MKADSSEADKTKTKKKANVTSSGYGQLDKKAKQNPMLEVMKKNFVSMFAQPTQQQMVPEKLNAFLKSKLRLKDNFIKKSLDKIKENILTSLDKSSKKYDPEIGKENIDFLLSIYFNIHESTNTVQGDASTSLYTVAGIKQEIVDENKEKDEAIRQTIKSIVISSLDLTKGSCNDVPSYSFITTMLKAFGEFIQEDQDSIEPKQIESILDYLISLIDQSDEVFEESNEEVKEPGKRTRSKRGEKGAKEDKPSTSSKDRPRTRSMNAPSKTPSDTKKGEAKECFENEEGNVDLVIPAILNFIDSYFLSKTPQNLSLEEYRKKRIEKRAKEESAKSKNKVEHNVIPYNSKDVKIDGLNQESVIKKDNLQGENGKPALCTFAKTGRSYSDQHWYMCYTCGLSGNEGVCNICAMTCHKGHELVYGKSSSFFCDCQFKFNCKSLPDEFKEGRANQSSSLDMKWGGFQYDSRDDYRDYSSGLFGGRGGYTGLFRGSRGGGRGGRGGRIPKKDLRDREDYEAYKKAKKKVKRSARKEKEPSYRKAAKEDVLPDELDRNDLDGQQDGAGIDGEDLDLDNAIISQSDRSDSDSEDQNHESENGLSDDLGEAPKESQPLAEELLISGGPNPINLPDEEQMLMYDQFVNNDKLISAPKAKLRVSSANPPDGDDNGEGEDDNEDEGEDKKMEEIEEDSKSMGSSDVRMGAEAVPKRSGEGQDIDPIDDEKDSKIDVNLDAEMELNTEEILDKYDERVHRIFESSSHRNKFPQTLIEKLQKLLNRIKKRANSSQGKVKVTNTNIDKVLEGIASPDKKIVFDTAGTTTKRSFNPGSVKMSSRAAEDNANNLIVGIAGQTNYLIPKN